MCCILIPPSDFRWSHWSGCQATPIHDHIAWCVFGVHQGEEYEIQYQSKGYCGSVHRYRTFVYRRWSLLRGYSAHMYKDHFGTCLELFLPELWMAPPLVERDANASAASRSTAHFQVIHIASGRTVSSAASG